MSDSIESCLEGMVGWSAWGTALGHGSFVTVEFGEATTFGWGGERGAWHLWVYGASWRIEKSGVMIAGCEDDREFLASVVGIIDGHTLESVHVDPASLSLDLVFSDRLVLKTFSVYTQEDAHWMLFMPDRLVLTAGPGATWRTVGESESPLAP